MENLVNVEVLKYMRLARGWDQLTLAQNAGIDPSIISRLERRLQSDLKVSILVAIAKALEAPVGSLLLDETLEPITQLVPELEGLIQRFHNLSSAQQRQVAAILNGYLNFLPNDQEQINAKVS